MLGLGSPKSNTYHLGLDKTIFGRLERVERQCREARHMVSRKANNMRKKRQLPPLSKECKAPDFFHVLEARLNILDWNYKGQSLQDFVDYFHWYEMSGELSKAMEKAYLWWKTLMNVSPPSSSFPHCTILSNTFIHSTILFLNPSPYS